VASESNKIVRGLWVGNRLSKIELLTIHSFIHMEAVTLPVVVADLDLIIPLRTGYCALKQELH
jgi:hypothetical protein